MTADRGEPAGRAGRLVRRGVWIVGAVVIALVLVVAGRSLLRRALAFLGELTLAELGLVVGGLVAAVTIVSAVYVLASDPRRRWAAFGVAFLLLVGVRLLAVWWLDPLLEHDPLSLHQLAVGVAEGQCCFADRPMGYPMLLGAAYALLGDSLLVAELVGLGIAVGTGLVLYDLVRTTWNTTAAAVALTVYALMPSQVLIVVVPLTEPLYGLALVGAVRLAAAAGWSRSAAAACGVIIGLGQYIRPTAVAVLPVFLVVPWLAERLAGREVLLRAGSMLVAFAIVMLPVAENNLRAHGDLSLSTSDYAGWTLYVGTNQEWDGQWNPDDAARLAGFPGETWWERSEVAGREGVRRITDDPGGFARLVPRKFRVLWADDDYAITHTLGIASTAPVLALLTSAAYVGLVAATLLGIWWERRRMSGTTLLILGLTATVAGIHVFVEVADRYHAYLIPLWCALAGVGVVWLLDALVRRITSVERAR